MLAQYRRSQPRRTPKAPQPPLHSITVSVMGELRLYAIGIEEVRGMFGAPPQVADHLRVVAQRAFAPPSMEGPHDPLGRGGLLSKLGPIFKRVPATPVISPTQPEPHDLEVLLAGAYVPPNRTGATWRLPETLVQSSACHSREFTNPTRGARLGSVAGRSVCATQSDRRHLAPAGNLGTKHCL